MSREITVYSASELKEKFPDAFDKAYEEFKRDISNDPYLPWQDEIMGSMKSCIKAAGVTLNDWSIGAYSYCYVKVSIPTYWSELADNDILVEDLEGRKAFNWLKNAFDLKSAKRVKYTNHLGKPAYRHDFTKLDGKSWSCEFTGVCFDHDFLESLFECIHDKMSLGDAFNNLADVAGKLFEQEYEGQLEEDYFLEHADANDYEYTEDGDRI